VGPRGGKPGRVEIQRAYMGLGPGIPEGWGAWQGGAEALWVYGPGALANCGVEKPSTR
jgi:hypothetical protein